MKSKSKKIKFIEKEDKLSKLDMQTLKGGHKETSHTCQVGCSSSVPCNVKSTTSTSLEIR